MPAFVEVILNAPQFVDELDKLKTGISDSGVNLTQNRFLELEVPYPPLDEQAAIVEAVEDQLSVIDHLESNLDAKLKNAQALRQSALRHAFSGKLVPQAKRRSAENQKSRRRQRPAQQTTARLSAGFAKRKIAR